MKSLRSNEGYFMSDNRDNAGVPMALLNAAGLPLNAGVGLFEAPTYTCSHCQRVVIMNPDRKRERVHCRGCDHLICDHCGVAKAAGAPCRTMNQIIDETLEAAAKQSVILI